MARGSRNRKIMRKKIYFFLEGKENCSEHLYISEYIKLFKDMKAIDVEFFPHACGDGSWKNISRNINKSAIDRDRKNTEIWCVMDKDSNNLDEIQKECNERGYKLVFSNLSFEVWLLLHFCKVSDIKEPTNKKYISMLSKEIGRPYEKCKKITFSRKEREKAVNEAKRTHQEFLAEKGEEEDSLNGFVNGTNFYEIVEKIRECYKDYKIK